MSLLLHKHDFHQQSVPAGHYTSIFYNKLIDLWFLFPAGCCFTLSRHPEPWSRSRSRPTDTHQRRLQHSLPSQLHFRRWGESRVLAGRLPSGIMAPFSQGCRALVALACSASQTSTTESDTICDFKHLSHVSASYRLKIIGFKGGVGGRWDGTQEVRGWDQHKHRGSTCFPAGGGGLTSFPPTLGSHRRSQQH